MNFGRPGALLGSSVAFGSGCGQALPGMPRKAPLCSCAFFIGGLVVVLIGIDANRLGARFPGQNQAWLPGIQLIYKWEAAN